MDCLFKDRNKNCKREDCLVNCGGTAKGSGNSELGNNSEESHITTSSQESSPQIFLYFEKHQKGYLELAIPTTEKVKQIKNRILFERSQARKEMKKKVIELYNNQFDNDRNIYFSREVVEFIKLVNKLGVGENK